MVPDETAGNSVTLTSLMLALQMPCIALVIMKGKWGLMERLFPFAAIANEIIVSLASRYEKAYSHQKKGELLVESCSIFVGFH